MVPPRIRAAAALLGVVGIGLIAYTVILTAPLLGNPDPMIGLELIVLGAAGLVLLSLVWKQLGYHAAGSWR
jgi:hypothetical protein